MKYILSISLMMLVSVLGQAQESQWSFHLGTNSAIGHFGQSSSADQDWALVSNSDKAGFGIGGDAGALFRRSISDDYYFDLLFGANFIISMPNADILRSSSSFIKESKKYGMSVTMKNAHFISIPLLIGIRYHIPLEFLSRLYVDLQAGGALNVVTTRHSEILGSPKPVINILGMSVYDYVYTDRFDPSIAWAFRFALGAEFGEHWVMDLSLFYASPYRIEGTEEFEIGTSPNASSRSKGSVDYFGARITPMILSLRIGYQLNPVPQSNKISIPAPTNRRNSLKARRL
ncbi:MAG: hypothetical protein IJ620_00770 [Bacteroidales bacterium]|nr:hypothetical protein [Bacteroidales bacterium]